ncbi:MAG: Stealth CR1 domain-containing protein, partial [Candidatus Gastranaerophilales bacterium]|nr:Stealth CR1 domain-containing protein [Candidatus Gastranaerophilales bacterium]
MENIKVDLVYTWVDGNDEEWKKKKTNLAKKLNKITKIEHDANSKCRFKNNDEQKYSLRSVEKYITRINHIYIVNENQKPDWLNTNHPKLTIIDHKEIIPKDCLPTFNSNTILHCMVNIPNLSEYFLYADDDMFFADSVNPEFFYTKEKRPICRFTKPLFKLKESIYRSMLYNAANLLKNKNYKFKEFSPHHNIDAYRKSIIKSCQNEFQEISTTLNNHFRTQDDIERIIYQYYAVATKRGIYKRVSKFDTFQPLYKRIYNYFAKNYSKDSQYFTCYSDNIYGLMSKYKLKLFCINDIEILDEELEKQDTKKILSNLFPDKSTYEL